MDTSTLWNTLISQGCEPEVIREDCLSPQDERFRRVAELTTLIFTKHGLRLGPRPIRKSQETDSDEEEEDRDQEDEVPDDENKRSESSVETNAASEQDWGPNWQDPDQEKKEKKDCTRLKLNLEEKKSF